MSGLTIFIAIIGIVILLQYKKYLAIKQAAKDRKDRIYQKYGQTDIAEKIIKKTIWVGESSEQVRDSIGVPIDIDEKVLKTKRKETWKYYPKGTNRYGLKVFVENGFVYGWDEKM